jgi:two-component sensor histidine kinase
MTTNGLACDPSPLAKDAFDDEASRALAIVDHGLADWDGAGRFDDVVGLLSKICDAPIVLVSLVEQDKQRFLGKAGLDASSTPRSVSFCSHAMRMPGIMVVPDATLDPRFADNALVTGEPGIRFYAGAPLVTASGIPLGALCVIDRVPREGLTPLQADAMRVLARNVMTIIEARREAEARDVIADELAHRIKNLFALFQSLIHFSSAHRDAGAMRDELMARTAALALAHGLVATGDTGGTSGIGLHALFDTLFAPYHVAAGARHRVNGADLAVAAHLVTPLSLVFHELATNAAKYGALAHDDGRVDIALITHGDQLFIEWRESGVAHSGDAPSHSGFGSRMVDMVVRRQLGGTLDKTWAEGGLVVRLGLPRAALS